MLPGVISWAKAHGSLSSMMQIQGNALHFCAEILIEKFIEMSNNDCSAGLEGRDTMRYNNCDG